MTTMEGSATQEAFQVFAARPNTPPVTPGSRAHSHYPSTYSHTSPTYPRFTMYQSPPLEHIEPRGGYQFNYTRGRQTDRTSSRPSSASGLPRTSSIKSFAEVSITSQERTLAYKRKVTTADFELGIYVSGDDSDVEVVLPNSTEEVNSDDDDRSAIMHRFKKLNCDDSDEEEEEVDDRATRYKMKQKKRWSFSHTKRTYAQSIEGDSGEEDVDVRDGHDRHSERRLRRRIRGPTDRSSLIFEDLSHLKDLGIKEEEEPIEESEAPPELDNDIIPLEALPFWRLDTMDVDSESASSGYFFMPGPEE